MTDPYATEEERAEENKRQAEIPRLVLDDELELWIRETTQLRTRHYGPLPEIDP